jgi:hypothetical protein
VAGVRPRPASAPIPVTLLVVLAALVLPGCVVATRSDGSGSAGGFSLFFVLVPLLFVALMAARLGRRRTRPGSQRAAAPWTGEPEGPSVEMLRAELSVLADDVLRLEPHVVLNDAARDDYEAAAHRYRVAQAALEQTTAPVDVLRVQRVVDEATWSMSRVRAILDGRTPPPPPEPLQRPGAHGEPALGVDDRARPVYVDAPVDYRSGWFAGGGGLFGGLLLGSMLGGFGGWIVTDELDDAGDEDSGWSDGSDW